MNWNAFKRLFHYLGRYKLRLILVMIAAVLSTLFTSAPSPTMWTR